MEPRRLLADFLREQLGLTGTNIGCDTSSCGACIVHVDGESVKSCTVLRRPGRRAPRSRRSRDRDQRRRSTPSSGRSTSSTGSSAATARPGWCMAAVEPDRRAANPSDEEIRARLEGNLCRCTGYHNIVRAVRRRDREAEGTDGGHRESDRASSARPSGASRTRALLTGAAQVRRQHPVPGMVRAASSDRRTRTRASRGVDTSRPSVARAWSRPSPARTSRTWRAAAVAWQPAGRRTRQPAPAAELDRGMQRAPASPSSSRRRERWRRTRPGWSRWTGSRSRGRRRRGARSRTARRVVHESAARNMSWTGRCGDRRGPTGSSPRRRWS